MRTIVYFFIVVLTISLMTSCKQDEDGRVEVFKIIRNDPLQRSINFRKFQSTYNTTFNFATMSIRNLNKGSLWCTPSFDYSKFYIYNNFEDSLVELDLKAMLVANKLSLPISVYVHSYDSIFMFFVRVDLVSGKTNGVDIVLFDSSLNICRKYSMDSLPYFYSDSDKMLMENNILNFQNRIIDNNLVIPLAVYSPNTSEASFMDFHPNQLCLLNLKDGKIKELNVKFPDCDIGKEYDSNVNTNMVLYYIINSDSILYSFPHSSTFYMLDVKKNISSVYKEYPDLPFYNSPINSSGKSLKQFGFQTPVFSVENNIFLRKIVIPKYKKYKRTEVVQVLDRKFNHLGFIAEKDLNISCKGNEAFVYDRNEKVPHPFSLGNKDSYSLPEFEELFMQIDSNNYPEGTHHLKDVSFEKRMLYYLENLGLNNVNKIVIINTDMMCTSCVDYLMSSLKNNESHFRSKHIVYLFVGSHIESTISLISQFEVKSKVEFDIKQIYTEYFFENELNNYHLIEVLDDRNIKIKTCTFDDFYEKIPKFLELKVK